MTQALYAIGDIHGQLGMLETALARIDADGGRDARVVFLGDYVDRGPDSKGVIDTLVQGQAAGRDWVCLKGNHDRFFEWYVEPDGPRFDPHLLVGYHWFHQAIGGVETIASYDVYIPDRIRKADLAAILRDAVPDTHKAFLRGLNTSHQENGYFFAHAGILPGVPFDQQDEQDLLWIRQEFHADKRDHGAVVVHGHTPVDAVERYPNRINLDTGAGYGRPLSVICIEGDEVVELTAQGRQRVPSRS
ncbi:metallophosphoesterase family protein [Marivita sp. S0852]|uniref:metallophosphoesterase family protein n=1 Tax=Marivita sp. S0852 TaxID=3373893 RepID=UPI00398291D8